jgi:proteasome lid subunit RPN8/RPN11
MTSVWIGAEQHSALMKHLSRPDVEHVAFLFCEPQQGSGPLRACELYPVSPEGFDYQSDVHVELTDEVRAHVIKRAHDIGGCLVEVHSHLGGPARFSASDLAGFKDWVPHVRWRLGGRPYVAIVFSGVAFDALVWEGKRLAAATLQRLEVEGLRPCAPSGLTLARKRWRWR